MATQSVESLALRPREAAKALGISRPHPLGTDRPARPDSLCYVSEAVSGEPSCTPRPICKPG